MTEKMSEVELLIDLAISSCSYPECNCAVSFPDGYKPSWATECPRNISMTVDEALTEALQDLNTSTAPAQLTVLQPDDTSDHAYKGIDAAIHAAELLRAQGNMLLAIAQSFKAESDVLADDIEARAKRFHDRVDAFKTHVDNARNTFKAESKKLDQFFPK